MGDKHAAQLEARAGNHATVQEHLDYIERLLTDSAEKHALWESSHTKVGMLIGRHEALGGLHASIEERLDMIEGQLGSLDYVNIAMDGALQRCQKRREIF